MTAQAGETLIYNGEEVSMATHPLDQYFSQSKEEFEFVAPLTCLWRGYMGAWEIKNDELFLIDFRGTIEGYQEVGMDYIFPGQTEVIANWFTGEIRIPQGGMLEYIHQGYKSLYAEDLFLNFKDGILIGERTVSNMEQFINSKGAKTQTRKNFWKRLFERCFTKDILD